MDKMTFDTLLRVAIAVIPPGLLRSLRFMKRFRAEIALAYYFDDCSSLFLRKTAPTRYDSLKLVVM